MDRIDIMQAFVTVAAEGSFTKAADKLDTSNQLISKYVSQLESHLGTRLFNRTTRKVHLTDAGEQCLEHAKHILESIQTMEGHFGQLQEQPQGLLRISAPVSFSTLHLAPLLGEFIQQYPNVGVDLQVNDRKVDVIEEGFDVAIRIGQLSDSSMIARRIAPIRMVLCAAPDYLYKHGNPSHPDELIAEDYLRYSYADYGQSSHLLNALRLNHKKYSQGIVANNGEILMAAAIAGKGYIFQPTFIVGNAIKQGKLTIILEEYATAAIGLYAVYPHRQLVTPKLTAFIDFLSERLGPEPYWDKF